MAPARKRKGNKSGAGKRAQGTALMLCTTSTHGTLSTVGSHSAQNEQAEREGTDPKTGAREELSAYSQCRFDPGCGIGSLNPPGSDPSTEPGEAPSTARSCPKEEARERVKRAGLGLER